VVIIDELADFNDGCCERRWKMRLPVLPEWHARLEYISNCCNAATFSLDVITGIMPKSQFRVEFLSRVTSKVDSRTVLDALGAKTLLGKGDMLFMDSKSARMSNT
jgi:S-DNA-T family DNA segregation ATPase FtsK/SpoIIIE